MRCDSIQVQHGGGHLVRDYSDERRALLSRLSSLGTIRIFTGCTSAFVGRRHPSIMPSSPCQPASGVGTITSASRSLGPCENLTARTNRPGGTVSPAPGRGTYYSLFGTSPFYYTPGSRTIPIQICERELLSLCNDAIGYLEVVGPRPY